jgi:lysophospholipase L1-like esterase
MYVGDSFTDGAPWPLTVGAHTGATMLNQTPGDPYRAAIAGTGLTVRYPLVAGWARRVQPFAPDDLFLLLGVNDYTDYCMGVYDMQVWRSAWEYVWWELAGMPTPPARVFVLGLPYLTGQGMTPDHPPWASSIADARAQMNRVTQDAAAAYGWRYVSLDTMTAAMIGPDRLHPNAEGQTYIAQRVIAALGG